MTTWLLDINVLIARQDASHEHHSRVAGWLTGQRGASWATCPITENGFIRILGHSSYPGWPGKPEKAAAALRHLISALPGHRFFPDEISLLDPKSLSDWRGVPSRAVTDLYLLGLAVHHKARFATLDTHMNPRLVPGGPDAHFVID